MHMYINANSVSRVSVYAYVSTCVFCVSCLCLCVSHLCSCAWVSILRMKSCLSGEAFLHKDRCRCEIFVSRLHVKLSLRRHDLHDICIGCRVYLGVRVCLCVSRLNLTPPVLLFHTRHVCLARSVASLHEPSLPYCICSPDCVPTLCNVLSLLFGQYTA